MTFCKHSTTSECPPLAMSRYQKLQMNVVSWILPPPHPLSCMWAFLCMVVCAPICAVDECFTPFPLVCIVYLWYWNNQLFHVFYFLSLYLSSHLPGPPLPPQDVQVLCGQAPGVLQVHWKPPILSPTGTSNGANVVGYAVCTKGQRVS